MLLSDELYRIEKCARGGYGTIHTCVDQNLTKYATKYIPIDNDGIPCLNEVSIMTTISHPYLNSALYRN